MSYEGYTEGLCEHGHFYVKDAYDDWPERFPCGAPLAWDHEVNQTNDSGTPATLRVRTGALLERCNLGHEHTIEQRRYYIPETGEN